MNWAYVTPVKIYSDCYSSVHNKQVHLQNLRSNILILKVSWLKSIYSINVENNIYWWSPCSCSSEALMTHRMSWNGNQHWFLLAWGRNRVLHMRSYHKLHTHIIEFLQTLNSPNEPILVVHRNYILARLRAYKCTLGKTMSRLLPPSKTLQ